MKTRLRKQLVITLSAALVTLFIGGCSQTITNHSKELNMQIADLHHQLDNSNRQCIELKTTLARQQKQIQTLQQLGDKRIENLFYVTDIKLGRYTGPADLDGVEGMDGIKVYLRPIDQSGDTIKASGQAKVQIYDLALEPEKNLLTEKTWNPQDIAGLFSGGFMTYHYTLELPWPKAPENPELTIRVEFTDYLTGKTFTAQKVCKIPLTPTPPAN